MYYLMIQLLSENDNCEMLNSIYIEFYMPN